MTSDREFSRRQFVAGLGGGALAAVFLAACAGDDRGEQAADGASGSSTSGTAAATRLVTHPLGEVEIPTHPKRVILLGSTITNVLALGIRPVGARNVGRDRRIHPELLSQFDGIVDFGGQDLDIEQIVALEPDLILGSSPGNDDVYGRLSQIAPTVFYDQSGILDHSAEWEKFLLHYADLLGEQDEARRLLADWAVRLADFRSLMGDRRAETVVSVVNTSNDELQFTTKGGFAGSVLEDAGLRRPPSQDLDASQTEAVTAGGDSGRYPVSVERLREADGDVLFLWANPSSAPVGDESQAEALREKTDALQADPLWRQLRAVQTGRVYEVGGHWRGFSILEANLILDDLYRGVLEEEPP